MWRDPTLLNPRFHELKRESKLSIQRNTVPQPEKANDWSTQDGGDGFSADVCRMMEHLSSLSVALDFDHRLGLKVLMRMGCPSHLPQCPSCTPSGTPVTTRTNLTELTRDGHPQQMANPLHSWHGKGSLYSHGIRTENRTYEQYLVANAIVPSFHSYMLLFDEELL